MEVPMSRPSQRLWHYLCANPKVSYMALARRLGVRVGQKVRSEAYGGEGLQKTGYAYSVLDLLFSHLLYLSLTYGDLEVSV